MDVEAKWQARYSRLASGLLRIQAEGIADPQSATAARDHTVVGRWYSLETSKGGIGAVFIFRLDGSLEFSPGVVHLFKYRIEGDRVLENPSSPNGSGSIQIELLTPDTLRIRLDQNPMSELVRNGKPEDPNHPLIGAWTFRGDGSTRKFYFEKDGTLLFSSGVKSQKGRYTIEGDQVRMLLEGSPAKEATLRWDGAVPVLRFAAPIMEMSREGKPENPNDLLLGTWVWTSSTHYPTSKPITISFQFRANGTCLMTASFLTDKGHYTIRGEQIRLEIDGYAPVEGSLRWDGEVLILPGPSGAGESRFERF